MLNVMRHKRHIASVSLLLLMSSAQAALPDAVRQLANKYKQLNSHTHVSSTPIESTIPVGELLLLTVNLENQPLSDVFAIKSAQQALLGITTLSQVLELPIDVSLENGLVEGWIYTEQNEIRIEQHGESLKLYRNGTLIGETDEFELADDDLYIEAKWLTDLLGLNFQFDYFGQTLLTQPISTLPIQEKLRRQRRKASKVTDGQPASMPERRANYGLFSDPALDFQLFAKHQKDQDSLSYSMLARQDFAYASGRFYLYGSKEDLLKSSRISFDRTLTSDNPLTSIGIHRWEAGDIQPVQSGRLLNSAIGRGIKFDSDDSLLSPSQEQVSISGDIQPNWDVELYLNGVLVDKQTSTEVGRYEFNNVRLQFGINRLEIVKYGPFGEVARENREVYFDGKSNKPWQSRLNVSLIQPNRYLLNQNESSDLGDYQLSANYRLTLPFGMQTYVGVSQSYGAKEDEGQFSTGLQGSVANLAAWQLNYEQNDLQELWHSNLQTTVLKQNLTFSLEKNTQKNEPLKNSNSASLQLSGLLPFNIGYQQNVQYADFGSTDDLYFQNQLSMRVGDIQLNHQFSWRNSGTLTRYGAMRISGFIEGYFTKFSASYDASDHFDWTNYELNISKRLNEQWQAQWSIEHNALNNINQYSIDLSWIIPQLMLTSSITYDKENDVGVNLLARTSLGMVTQDNAMILSSTPLSNAGSLIVRVFTDENVNGRYDQGEPLLPNVKVISRQSFRTAITQNNGVAILKSLPPNQRTDIEIDFATLPDPFMVRADKGFSITPRAGLVEYADIPITLGGEIDGTVYDDTTGLAAAYVDVELVNAKGEVVSTTKSEPDGYFLFNEIHPGHYFVRAAATNKKVVGLSLAEFKFSSQGEIYTDVELAVRKPRKSVGYIAEVQQFSHLKLLKMYWKLLKKRFYGNASEVFYVQDPHSKRFQLAAGYFEKESDAQTRCDVLYTQNIQCEVKKVEVEL